MPAPQAMSNPNSLPIPVSQRDDIYLQFLNRFMKGEEMKVVPASEALPMIDEAELAELRADILPATASLTREAWVKVVWQKNQSDAAHAASR